jgi:hypothetical protein
MDRNERNKAFWDVESGKADRLQADPWVVGRVLNVLASELARDVPSYSRTDFRAALSDADAERRDVLKHQARRGGQAKKPDLLQERIVEIVRTSPKITCHELLSRLRDEAGGLVIEDIDEEEIWFNGRNGSSKSAPLSGLKDRLSRAKEICRSL